MGININPDKKCTFNCVYCQVDRKKEIENLPVTLDQINEELVLWLNSIREQDGFYKGFQLKDISLAGDGEPTLVDLLPDLIRKIIETKNSFNLQDCKIVLFTNGSKLNRLDLEEIWADFFNNKGEIWFKLDFWDETSLKWINRTGITAERLLGNLVHVGKQYPLVLQSCFFSWENQPFKVENYSAYVELIHNLLQKGVRLKFIQAYTLARTPAEEQASPWSNLEMDLIDRYLKKHLPVKIGTYYEKGN